MSLIDDFKGRFPAFDTDLVDSYWDSIEGAYPCYYGGAYTGVSGCDTEIILNLCAHLFLVQSDASTGPARAEESKTIGSVSVSYSSLSDRGSFFMSTKYGQLFLQLTSARACGGFFV